MAIAIRSLAGSLSILEILTVRAVLGLLIVLAIMAVRPELRHSIKTQRIGLHLLRNGVHFGSQYLWACSLLLLPLATVFALEFTMPAWTILLAPFFLGERMTPSRIGAVILGIAGVLVIVRPGMETFQPASLMVLAAAFGYAINIITTKKLTATDSTFAIVFWMNAIQIPLGVAFAGVTFVSKFEWQLAPAIIAHRHRRVVRALLHDQRIPGGRRERRGAARLFAHPADCGGRLVAVRGTGRHLRFYRRWVDHQRHPVELAQRNPPSDGCW